MSELRPIGNKTSIPELMTAIKTQAWIFEKFYEKAIVTGSILWAAYSIIKFIVSFII
jgi:hypothetical protein